VRARCVRSQIHSEPDTQAITKKAIVEALKRRWPRDWFDETGAEVPIVVTIRRDRVSVALDTTGRGLHRRGYRILTGGAPLRETMAAALLQLSYWEPGRVLGDPCCGTGTILIEAAWMAANRAPGLGRGFLAEEWPWSNSIWNGVWKEAREEAADLKVEPPDVPLLGGDINPKALELARRNAAQARVETAIEFQQLAVADFGSHHKYGCVVTNPPYGERMGERQEAEAVYGDLGRLARRLETWSVYAMSAHRSFEKIFAEVSGRGGQVRRRKLYNGPIECTYFQYAGPRPPWN
jgi:putative N6-adenine-specific DNA methylase